MYKHLFGPVPSRRLGRSLGVDLVPLKTCSFNCVFCQAGRTPQCTVARKEYVRVPEVIAEFDRWLREHGSADAITLSGSGEPTLHSRFGEVLAAVKERCPIRTALLSNGSLFWQDEVRADARKADIVKLSLSAWDQASLERINRPGAGVQLDRMIEGMQAFRREFRGELWIEVVVLAGLNATRAHMRHIAELAGTVRPDRIQLNAVTRPPAESAAVSPPADVLESFAGIFVPRAELIPDPADAPSVAPAQTVGKRPVTSVDHCGEPAS